MTAPIDIECPTCASIAGNYCVSATTDPPPRQRVAFYHSERVDAAFRQLDALRDALMFAAYIGGANDANDGVKCKRETFKEWEAREAPRLSKIRRDDPRALLAALREALTRLAKHEPTDVLTAAFTRMELAITITSLRERFPGSSPTADRLESILREAQDTAPAQAVRTTDDLRFILTTREVFKL